MEKPRFILTEYSDLSVTKEQISESVVSNNGKLVVPCLLQKADVVNANNRVYPLSTLQREVKNYQRLVEDNRAIGELDHPDASEVSLKDASHVIRKIWWENGNEVHGTLEVLSTPNGNILRSLMEAGVKIGISSRAVGSLREDKSRGVSIVEDDLVLVAWDIVSDPSTPGAFLRNLHEAKNFDMRKIFTRSDRIHRILNNFV